MSGESAERRVSGQVRLARVNDLRVGKDVDQGRPAGFESPFQRRAQLARPALERAFESGAPTLINVLTDPEIAYPRKANLA